MKTHKPTLSAVLLAAAGLSLAGFVGGSVLPQPTAAQARSGSSELASLAKADAWLNSPPLTAASLRGKVVLVEFWTYTCINWLRTQPHLRAWHEKYKDQGLVVIGVHAPEFSFEKDAGNVRSAAEALGVDYPVAVDNQHAIWRAFDNAYWPALYLIDAQGRIRHQQFGEGGYAQSEAMIQQLLREAGARDVDTAAVSVEGRGPEAAADWDNLGSGENYLGYERTRNFASSSTTALNRPHRYALSAKLRLNEWALSGDWTIKREAIALDKPNGRIAYRFHARDLHLVMGPKKPETPVRFRVLIDGQAPGASHGSDIDAQGYGTLTRHRLYQLIRQPGAIADRQFEIEFLDPGAEAYSFTFG